MIHTSVGHVEASGQEVHISPKELEHMNFRMLSSQEKQKRKCFMLPRELPVSLLRVRMIFARLREQSREHSPEDFRGGSYEENDKVPIEAFQRAFERLFFLLGDPLGFVAKDYDENSDGFVSWAEFYHVHQKRDIKIRLSLVERIFLTFDDPDSSHLAQIVSIVVLAVIILSSLTFIIGTLPEWQHQDPPLSQPKANPEFETVENICLVLFVCEYLARALTVWDVRSELFDEEKVVEIIVGYEPLRHTPPWLRLMRFVLMPSNMIDLAAILPAILSIIMDQGGTGFVVLRLIRLTRIFRAFKNPALAEPVVVISQTISQSTKALYVLVFNFLLGIVIFGSLMYLAEGQGRWNVGSQAYERKSGTSWNSTSLAWDDMWEISPFQSIPHTFWWAIVTATTVGYGDHYPTTSVGKIVAVMTMVFSLVILALPVGVIGGTFSQVWDDYKKERQNAADRRNEEMVFVTSAIQRLDPTRMSTLMLIAVWNDKNDNLSGSDGLHGRNSPASFMGEVTLTLELPPDEHVVRTQKLRLENNYDLVRRTVSGHITVRYEWTPKQHGGTKREEGCGSDDSLQHTGTGSPRVDDFRLCGTLKLSLISGDGLVNLDFTKKNGLSSPYCMVLCYPNSPVSSELTPCVWRSPSVRYNLSPYWDTTHTFEYAWKPGFCHQQVTVGHPRASHWHNEQATIPKGEPKMLQHSGTATSQGAWPDAKGALSPKSGPPLTSPRAALQPKLEEVLSVLRELGADLVQVRQEVRCLSHRVDKLPAYADSPAQQANGHAQGRPMSASPAGPEHPLLPNWVPAE